MPFSKGAGRFRAAGTIPEESAAEMLAPRLDARLIVLGIGMVRDAGDKHGVGLALAGEARPNRQARDRPVHRQPRRRDPSPRAYGAFMGQPIEITPRPKLASPRACSRGGSDQAARQRHHQFQSRPGDHSAADARRRSDGDRRGRPAHGKQTFAHASGTDGVENSIDGGVNTVEHGFFITEAQLAKMRDRHIAWVPTSRRCSFRSIVRDLGWDATSS